MYIASAPAVYAAPVPVVEPLPVPAVIQAPTPVVKYLAPVPSGVQAPSPVVESVAQCHAPVFPLSWVSLPVPIKTCTTDVSAEAEGQACETRAVFHDRGLPAVSRDRVVSSQWLRKEAARQGYAWRQRRRAQQLCSLRAACLPPGGVVSWWRHFANWQREGRVRVRVARVLERVLGPEWLSGL